MVLNSKKMSILCSICHDLITEGALSDHISLLRCGHLFHTSCIEKWFTHQNNVERTGGTCPCCKKPASFCTAIQIFPMGDEDSNSIAELKKSLQEAKGDNENVVTLLEKVKGELCTISNELGEETEAHDASKFQYVQALSKLHVLEEKVSDNLRMNTVLENSAKTQMDKLKRETKEAQRTIMDMEEREKMLLAEIESLRNKSKVNK